MSAVTDATLAPGLIGSARALIARDLRLLWRRRGDALQPALFALLTVMLFALALGGERAALAKVAAGVLWLACLLAGLLALDSLFRGDAEDGSLEQWMLAPVPLGWLVAVRTRCRCCSPRRCWANCCTCRATNCRCCWPRWRSVRRC